MIEQNIVYFGEPGLLQRNTLPTRPLTVVFLTSVRDTGKDDRNGRWVEVGNGSRRYMEGTIERTVRETHPWYRGPSEESCRGMLAGIVRVGGVITDDTPKDMQKSSYSSLPESGRAWIFPRRLSTPEGLLITDMTYNIPSSFRLLPKRAVEERWFEKLDFESRVLRMMRELGGDVLVSDHYMARIDFLYQNPALFGRLLNIHPAVTVENHPFRFRGKYPTADTLARARSDRSTQIQTGATLHFIGPEIDKGQPIAYVVDTPVYPHDEPQWLRYRNYNLGKLPLFVHGLAHYARNIYPYLDKLWSVYSPEPHPIFAELSLNPNGRAHLHENILLS